jgi:hypothetical protein
LSKKSKHYVKSVHGGVAASTAALSSVVAASAAAAARTRFDTHDSQSL